MEYYEEKDGKIIKVNDCDCNSNDCSCKGPTTGSEHSIDVNLPKMKKKKNKKSNRFNMKGKQIARRKGKLSHSIFDW